jgi:anti-sigma regulatory factor (Ser/Thr protein kinase)
MSDEITLTLPRDREFHRVAHLVLSGLALRLDLTIEALEDMQIGLAALLNRADPRSEVTVAMSAGKDVLEASVGPLDLERELEDPEGEGLDLRRVLAAVVDDVDVGPSRVTLSKRVVARDR